MAIINIKELFVTDLDPNSGVWWSKDKVDKINYNFVQLSNGGTPGPQGNIGADGGTGNIGAQGYTGYKGPQGYQGVQGAGSLNDWDYFPEAEGLPGYLFPRKNPIGIDQSAPVALRIGYLSTDPEYDDGVDPIYAPIQSVKAADTSWVNLRVEDNSNINGYNFNFGSSNGDPRFEISPSITSNKFKIIYTAQTIILKTGSDNSALRDSIIITDALITIDTGGIYGVPFNLAQGTATKSQDTLRFTTGADIDKVLVATDSTGNLAWKDVKEIFGTFPIGSIISIRPDEFITDHFWLNDSITVTTGSPLNNIYGRGKVGTDYEGWYLCNGETWETTQGFNQYLTPNLNNFSYTITGNGDAQNQFIVSETDPILIGGYDMQISAIPDLNGIYSIVYSNSFLDNDTSPGISTISMGASGLYETSRMIHIVYLENSNLKWSHTGTYVPPPPAAGTIMLTLPSTPALCDEPVNTNYSWTGPTVADWNTFAIPSTYKLFNYGTTTYAPSGWYINIDGYPIRWNNTSGTFTARGTTCQPTSNMQSNLKFDLLVDELNGPLASFTGTSIYLDFGTGSFATATTLVWGDDSLGGQNGVGSNAPASWYRDKTTGVRRYWNGSAFIGVSFTENYVSRVTFENDGAFDPGYNNANIALAAHGETSVCDFVQASHLTYVAGNVPFVWSYSVSGISFTNYVKQYDSALYVTRLWAEPLTNMLNEPNNTPALVNIKDQNKPGSTTLKYNKVYISNGTYNGVYEYATLSTSGLSATGKLTSVIDC